MNIGIDIDDTLVYTVNTMIKYADKYDILNLGRKGINGNFGLIKNRYYLKALYGWNDKEKYEFFNKYYKDVLEECEIMPNADKIVRKLKEEGHKLFFITARLNNIKNCNTQQITKNMLEKNNIPWDELIINASNKLEVCKQKDIDIFIEDSYETCQELLENGIKSILMTTKMNEQIASNCITRVTNWNEIYDIIKSLY